MNLSTFILYIVGGNGRISLYTRMVYWNQNKTKYKEVKDL